MSEHDDYLDDLGGDPLLLAGVWADRTLVHRVRSSFTIDFIRHVPDPLGRLLVARAVIAPAVAVELREQLDEAWREYSGGRCRVSIGDREGRSWMAASCSAG